MMCVFGYFLHEKGYSSLDLDDDDPLVMLLELIIQLLSDLLPPLSPLLTLMLPLLKLILGLLLLMMQLILQMLELILLLLVLILLILVIMLLIMLQLLDLLLLLLGLTEQSPDQSYLLLLLLLLLLLIVHLIDQSSSQKPSLLQPTSTEDRNATRLQGQGPSQARGLGFYSILSVHWQNMLPPILIILTLDAKYNWFVNPNGC